MIASYNKQLGQLLFFHISRSSILYLCTYYNQMQNIISQFASILKFNRYFIVGRLRQRYNQQQVKEILDKVMQLYQDKLHQQYQILCKVIVQHQGSQISIFETQTNITSGTIHRYEQGQLSTIYKSKDINSVDIIAFYHKVMPFKQIVALSSQKKQSPNKKYRNKNFDQIIQVSEKQLMTPKKPSSEQKHSSINNANKTVRKLMIVSQSQSMQVEPQKSFINIESDESMKEDIIIQSLLQKNKVAIKKSQKTQEKMETKKIEGEKPALQQKVLRTIKKQKKRSKWVMDQKQIESQSSFMLKWLNKDKIHS